MLASSHDYRIPIARHVTFRVHIDFGNSRFRGATRIDERTYCQLLPSQSLAMSTGWVVLRHCAKAGLDDTLPTQLCDLNRNLIQDLSAALSSSLRRIVSYPFRPEGIGESPLIRMSNSLNGRNFTLANSPRRIDTLLSMIALKRECNP